MIVLFLLDCAHVITALVRKMGAEVADESGGLPERDYLCGVLKRVLVQYYDEQREGQLPLCVNMGNGGGSNRARIFGQGNYHRTIFASRQ